MSVSPVPRERIAEEWRRVSGLVMPAAERFGGTHGAGDILGHLMRGEAQLWAGDASALLTEIVAYPRVRACRAWLAGGDLAEIKQMAPVIEDWARRERNCTRGEIMGRDGWERALEGYRRVCAVLVKEL